MTKTHQNAKVSSSHNSLTLRLFSIVCLIGGLQVATQYFAHQFNYQPQLGTHLFHIYEPWAIGFVPTKVPNAT